MIKITRYSFILPIFFLIASTFAADASGDVEDNVIKTDIAKALSKAFPSSNDLEKPGYALRISRRGETVFEAFSGAADIEQSTPISTNTVFHIASLSKQITGASLAFAINDGALSLDDPVGKWIPEAEKYGSELTIAHLVYMTSGLTEYTSLPGPNGRPWATFHYFTTDDAIKASLAVETLQFQPGQSWQYSNINYMLLTRIIENAYNQPFSTFTKENIFTPLGMSETLINDDITTLIPNRANAYIPRQQGVIEELKSGARVSAQKGEGWILIRRNAPHYGGSGVMTSMTDWSRWQEELLTKSKFGDAFWKLMLSRRQFEHNKSNDAFGLVHGDQKGRASLWYSGGDIDTSTYAIALPETGIVISCFSNNPADSCEQKARTAIEILIDKGAL